jgi:teichuronic acid exporter
MSLKEKAVKGVVWVFVDKIFNQILPFIVYIYLANILAPSDFGLIGMLTVFTLFTKILVDSGFSSGLIQKGKSCTKKDFSTVFYINILVAVILYCFLFFCAPIISSFYSEPKLEFLSKILFLTVIIDSFGIIPIVKLTIDFDFKQLTKINIIVSILSLGIAIFMVNNDFSYWALVGLHLSRSFLSSILFLFMANWRPIFIISKQTLNDLLSFSLKFTLSVFVTRILSSLNILLLGRYFDSVQIGFFTQAQGYSDKVISVLGSTLQSVTFPILSSVNTDKERMIEIYKKIFQLTAFVSIPCLFGLAAISRNFVIVFLPSEWLPIIPVMQYLSLAGALTPILWLNVAILNANKRSDLFLKINIFKLPVSFLILFFTVPQGIEAIALGQVVFSIFSFFVNAYYPGKLFGFGIIKQLKMIIPIILSSSIMMLLIRFVELENMKLTLLFKVSSGVFVFIVLSCLIQPKFMNANYILLKKNGKSNN